MSGQRWGTVVETEQHAELVDKQEVVCLNVARIYALEYSSVIRKLETRSHIFEVTTNQRIGDMTLDSSKCK